MDPNRLTKADYLLFHVFWWRELHAPPKGRWRHCGPISAGMAILLIAEFIGAQIRGAIGLGFILLGVCGFVISIGFQRAAQRRGLYAWLETQDEADLVKRIAAAIKAYNEKRK